MFKHYLKVRVQSTHHKGLGTYVCSCGEAFTDETEAKAHLKDEKPGKRRGKG